MYTPNAAKTHLRADGRRRRNPKNEVKRRKMPQAAPDDDRFFVIEKLLKKRFNTKLGYDEYLVRWANYPPEWDSWEPVIELARNSIDLINEFNNIERNLDEKAELHCICRLPYRFDEGGMIQCFNCLTWFHFKCLGINMEEANSYAKYYCGTCRYKNPSFVNLIKEQRQVSFYSQ